MIAVVLRPIAALILFGLILLPAKYAVQKWMPEGRLKRLLLADIKPGGDADWSKQGSG